MNNLTAIDRIPKKQLENRYSIKEGALNHRIKSLGIKPAIDGRNSYISGEDLAKLDKLHRHLEDGGTITNFAPEKMAIVNTSTRLTVSSAQKLEMAIEQSNEPFIALLLLQKFNDTGWLIDTKRLAIILGISYHTLIRKKEYKYCGFICSKVGKEQGISVWKVKLITNY